MFHKMHLMKYLVVLTALVIENEADGRYCSASVRSVRVVPSCPSTKTEAAIAARKKNCEAVKQNCTKPSKFKYHCVINVFENATLEVCAPAWIILGYCTEFNVNGGRIQPHYSLKCTELSDPCPSTYPSNEAYLYKSCYDMVNNRSIEDIDIADPKSSFPMENTIAIACSIIIILVLITVGVIWYCRKRRKRTHTRGTEEDEQRMLLESGNTNQQDSEQTDETKQKISEQKSRNKKILDRVRNQFMQSFEKLKSGVINTDRNNLGTYINPEDDGDDTDVDDDVHEDNNSEFEEPRKMDTDDKNEFKGLFILLASLHKDTWKTAKDVRRCMIKFQKKHKNYFKLFRMEMYCGKSLSSDFDKSMTKLRKCDDFLTLREIYAVSEMLNRKILLIKNVCGNDRAIAICPVLLGFSKETEPFEIEIEIHNEKPTFRCPSPDRHDMKTVAEKLHIINKGHEFCFDKRFRNNFELLHDENYFPSYEYMGYKSVFEIFGTLIYGADSSDEVDILKMCLAEHENDKDVKEIYTEFIDVDEYSNADERNKYEETNDGDKEKLRRRMKEKRLDDHLKQWKSITQGDLFAISSIFGFDLYLEEEHQWHMMRPLCSERTQMSKGSFSLKRVSKACFVVDDTMTVGNEITCLCLVKTPTVPGILNYAESLISDRIEKNISTSREVCCSPVGHGTMHSHLYAVQKADVNVFRRLFWTPQNRQDPVEGYQKPGPVQRRVKNHLEETFRQVDLSSDGSLEKCLSKEIYGFENNDYSKRLKTKLRTSGNNFSSKMQKATDFVGVSVYVFSVSSFQWQCFEPKKKRPSSKCNFYITLLQTGDDGDQRLDRIVPKTGCNCSICPPNIDPDTNNANIHKIKITKEQRHKTLLCLLKEPHRKFLSELFENENRCCAEIPKDVDKAEIDLILSDPFMSGRSIDATSNFSSSLFRCISKEIFGSEKHFDIVENLLFDADNEVSLQNIDPKLDPDGSGDKHWLQTIANLFECSLYVIRLNAEKDQARWKEFKPAQKTCGTKIQPRNECGGKFYITLYYSTKKHFHRIVGTGKVCNCELDPPNGSEKDITMTNKKEHRHESKEFKDARHTWDISFLLELYTTDEVLQTPVFSTLSESSISKCENMRGRAVDMVSDSSFSLCRCFSKEVFGTEERHELIRNLLVSDIRCDADIYMDLIKTEMKELKQEEALKNTKTATSSCVNLITDGIEMPSLQLQAAANIFHCSIFVMNITEEDERLFSVWEEYKPNKTNNYADKGQAGNVCKPGAHYITLYKTFTGYFYRIVPKWEICNCCLQIPDVSKRNLILSDKSDRSIKANQQLLLTKAAFTEWWRSVSAFEFVLISAIQEMEGRLKGVNIATIAGSSISMVGAVLTAIGIIGAPVTAGVSLSLTIAGGVIAGSGAITAVGAKFTEMALSRNTEIKSKRYQIKIDVLSNLLERNLEKLQQKLDAPRNGKEAIHRAIPFVRGMWGVGSVPLVVLRVLSKAVVEAEAVFLPVAFVMDVAQAGLAAKNLYDGSVTPESLSLRNHRNRLRLVRQQMRAWMFGNSEDF